MSAATVTRSFNLVMFCKISYLKTCDGKVTRPEHCPVIFLMHAGKGHGPDITPSRSRNKNEWQCGEMMNYCIYMFDCIVFSFFNSLFFRLVSLRSVHILSLAF